MVWPICSLRLELELEESSKPDEAETDCDGYLKPVDFPAPSIVKKIRFSVEWEYNRK